uniref:Uncharacterized protein n=1 Tax=Brassica oleracea var. oleracea TaxID=109376 RepID=A0A0D3AQ47_BRAOL
MYASLLSIMRLVTKTKSVEYMSFFLSLFVFLCGTSWFIYGLIGRDPFVAEKKSTGSEKDEKKTVEMKDEEKKQNVVYGKQQEQQIKKSVVCGIASLGYDHIEILGHTLAEISAEKAGIFKSGVPAFTVPQPDEAMSVLDEKASELELYAIFI